VKVYLATSGEYSDYGVCHAFSRREDAEAYPLGDDVLELEVHDGPVEVRFWYEMSWVPRWPDRESDGLTAANPYISSEQRDFDGDERHVRHEWDGPHAANGPWLTVQGWDKQVVLKVYGEQRAQYLARQEGVS